MVYSGRPSSGCTRCRERRKKCDETKPSCLNCIRLGRECPGYPDQLDLLFKHETENVTRKATRVKKQSKAQASSPGCKESATSSNASNSTFEDAIDPSLSRQTNIAINYSMQSLSQEEPTPLTAVATWDVLKEVNLSWSVQYVSTAQSFNDVVQRPRPSGCPSGFFDVLIPMFSASPDRSPLHMATEAIAVRTVATLPGRSKDLFEHADCLYGMALQVTRHAITDPEQALTHENLLAVHLFALYKSVRPPAIDDGSKDVQGAVALAKARGPAQLQEPQSLALSGATTTQAPVDAIQRQESLGDFPGSERWSGDRSKDSASGIKSSIKMPGVLARAKVLVDAEIDRTPTTFQQVEELLRDAYDLQNELYHWDMNIPAQFGYKAAMHSTTIPRTDNVSSTEIWPGPVHEYRDAHAASIRNNSRVSQLLCANVVIGALRWLDPDNYLEDRRYRAVAYRVRYLVDDIAASVPFSLGYKSQQVAPADSNQQMDEIGQYHGAYLLIWPLYVCAQMRCISALQRKWLNGRLDTIAKRYGVHETESDQIVAGADSTSS